MTDIVLDRIAKDLRRAQQASELRTLALTALGESSTKPRGQLGIAHALAEAGYMPIDEYLRTYGGGEYAEPCE